MLLRVRRLRLGAPIPPVRVRTSSSTLIALVKLLLRLRSQARIGVRAAGNKTNEQTGRGSAPEKTSTSANKAYDLTKHLHPRPPYLTSYIGVRLSRLRPDVLHDTGISVWRRAA